MNIKEALVFVQERALLFERDLSRFPSGEEQIALPRGTQWALFGYARLGGTVISAHAASPKEADDALRAKARVVVLSNLAKELTKLKEPERRRIEVVGG